MQIKHLFFILCLFTMVSYSRGQELSFSDSIKKYNDQRIAINKTGLEVQGAWGLANIAAGSIGYFGAKEGEGKYFSEMNGIFGILNTGVSLTGLHMVKKQLAQKFTYAESYNWYCTDKKIYLIGAGIDIIYISAGFGLAAYGLSAKSSADVYTGFGKSLALQGVFLLLFDNIMLLEHGRNTNKWYRIMDELRFTHNGVGFNYSF